MDLQLLRRQQTPGGTYLTFVQTYRNTPIHGTLVKLKVNPDGSIPFLMDNLLKGWQAPRTDEASFSLSEAQLQVRLQKQWGAFEHQLQPVWFAREGRLLAAYRSHSHARQSTESYELILHARSGQELQRQSLTAYHSHATTSDTSGQGRLFMPNPCTRAGVDYGDLFANNDDLHLPIFETYMDTVDLLDIRYDGQRFYLEGPYVEVIDYAPPSLAPVSSPDGTFFYRRDESGFEDVMGYYHIDSYQRYVQSLGYTDLDSLISIDTHAGTADQSSFSTNMRISYGTNYGASNEHVDDAEDADVIVHEYGHALAHMAAPNTRSGNQRRGLEEGYCDYFAAAYSYDMRDDFGWEKLFNWDGHNEFWDGRSAVSTRKFQPSGFGIYQYAEIWASAMMRLRLDIGGEVTDRLQLEMLYGNVRNMTFYDAYLLVQQADQALYQGVHEAQIREQFCEAEVLSGQDCLGVGLDKDLQPEQWSACYRPEEGIVVDYTQIAEQSREGAQLQLSNLLGQIFAPSKRTTSPK
jgi:hypothetical protein